MNYLIILILGFLFSSSILKANGVPDFIKKSFQEKFPSAKKVRWEMEERKDYEASFLLNGKEVSVTYSPEGQLKETEEEIATSELPKAVIDALNKKHPNIKIHEAAKIERSDNTIVYETEVRINRKKTDLLFDQNGNETK